MDDKPRDERDVVEDIAMNISTLSNGVRKMLGGKLNKNALIVLLANSTKLPKRKIEQVLEAIANLDKNYLMKK